MATRVVGASGATGRLLAEQMIKRGQHVRAIVRTSDSLSKALRGHDNLSIVQASLLDLSDAGWPSMSTHRECSYPCGFYERKQIAAGAASPARAWSAWRFAPASRTTST